MFLLAYTDQTIEPNQIANLDTAADTAIKLRGYDVPRVAPPPELRKTDWFLPVSETVSDYCPTDRYSFWRKTGRQAELRPTWESFVGRVVEDTYLSFFKMAKERTEATALRDLVLSEMCNTFRKDFLDSIKSKAAELKGKMTFPPAQE